MGIQQQIGTPPMPAVARILARYERPQLEAFLTIAIDLLDTMDPDPDLEQEDRAGESIAIMDFPDVPDPDEGEPDPDLESVGAEDDFEIPRSQLANADHGAGCPISDPGACEHDGREPDVDQECQQMAGDVPTVPCYAIEPEADGKRRLLGPWNPAAS